MYLTAIRHKPEFALYRGASKGNLSFNTAQAAYAVPCDEGEGLGSSTGLASWDWSPSPTNPILIFEVQHSHILGYSKHNLFNTFLVKKELK